MKTIIIIAFISLVCVSCKRVLTPEEKQLCGKWMMTNGWYNTEWVTLKQDGSFTDRYVNNRLFFNAESFAMDKDILFLQYKWLVVLNSTSHYKIIERTDSTLIIASRGSKRYPSKTYHLKKMKLHGKFIVT